MKETIRPAARLEGAVTLPGDKSISHRYGMLAALAEGDSIVYNYSQGADCQSTLGAMRALGISIETSNGVTTVHGKGLEGLSRPEGTLDAGNSGSTIRMLSGILAAQPFRSEIGGDESLSRRPMRRILDPLGRMGARITAREGQFPPLSIEGAALRSIEYTLPVASAQVKSCILLAGLFAGGVTTVVEPMRTRDHTEIALQQFGVPVEIRHGAISVSGGRPLRPAELTVPGDLSAAAFILVAALLLPGSDVVLRGVGLNPTRSALLDFLVSIGAPVEVLGIGERSGELSGDLRVRGAQVTGGTLSGAMTAALIDEIPVLAVLGAASRKGLSVRDAAELRVKETDRIATVAENFRRMGLQITVRPDGFDVPGGQRFQAAALDSFGDHRIGMAFAVAALAADGESTVENAEAASVSFPGFYSLLRDLAR
jgi:3-phosphoshikimate 1-carboxyvinyltransferase